MPTKRKSTRAAQGAGTIRQRPDGRWEARYTVGRDPGTGRQVQKSIYGNTQKEVLDKLTAIKAALNSGTYTEPSKLTMGQWLDIWLADYLGNVKDAMARSYRDNVALHIKPALGAVPLQKLNAHTIQSLYNNLLRSGRIMQKGQKKEAPAGLLARSVRIVHAVLHMALKQAVAIGYIKANPSEVCTLPRTEKKEMEILAAEEIASFLSAIEDHKHGALFLFILFSCVRRGEALGLTWDAIDFTKETILISKQMQRERVKGGQLRFVPLKNDKQRRISPPHTIFQSLRKHNARQSEERLRLGLLWIDNGLVFTNEVGGPLDGDAVYKSYKRLLAANGLSNIRLHDLRHTAATLMIQNGDSVKAVQAALGHHSAAFTLDVYGHVTDDMKKESSKRMEEYIWRIKTDMTASKG